MRPSERIRQGKHMRVEFPSHRVTTTMTIPDPRHLGATLFEAIITVEINGNGLPVGISIDGVSLDYTDRRGPVVPKGDAS